ncbi:hypothetical protein TUM20985_55640 [Mycobacterium antarcticum]|nr:hypothetical protein TUM20985_55640 [Mycolicibacterium sp. TUM20985]GLP81296.1 hypothetical protein TUM20984_27160 [Mycolicibacterium sp. TUM20984]
MIGRTHTGCDTTAAANACGVGAARVPIRPVHHKSSQVPVATGDRGGAGRAESTDINTTAGPGTGAPTVTPNHSPAPTTAAPATPVPRT